MKIGKFLSSLSLTLFYRLLRIFPNSDPIMGFMLPFAKKEKLWVSALFAFLAMALFDLITFRIGIWTIVTASVYAGLAVFFHYFLKKWKKMSLKKYIGSGIFGILVFDAITGPLMTSLIFQMPFELALFGQIPFTIMHLISGIAFIALIVPVLDRDVAKTYAKFFNTLKNNLKQLIALKA